jgi:tRNA modification GTPase
VDPVEAIGIERTWAAVERADLVLLLVDARAGADALDAEDQAILARLPTGIARVVVHNKADLADMAPMSATRGHADGARRHVWISANVGAGIELLEREVLHVVGAEVTTEDTFLARERHVLALRSASLRLATAAELLTLDPPPVELFAEELREAQAALSAITGEFTADDLLGVIFGRFCIGK